MVRKLSFYPVEQAASYVDFLGPNVQLMSRFIKYFRSFVTIIDFGLLIKVTSLPNQNEKINCICYCISFVNIWWLVYYGLPGITKGITPGKA